MGQLCLLSLRRDVFVGVNSYAGQREAREVLICGLADCCDLCPWHSLSPDATQHTVQLVREPQSQLESTFPACVASLRFGLLCDSFILL